MLVAGTSLKGARFLHRFYVMSLIAFSISLCLNILMKSTLWKTVLEITIYSMLLFVKQS